MDGRIMYEFARRKAPEDAPNTAKIGIKTEALYHGEYIKLELERSVLGKYNYPNSLK
jgi:hypothetical protein